MRLPDRNDPQGLTRRAYSKLLCGCYLLLQVRDADAARAWISSTRFATAELLEPIDNQSVLQIAFTAAGLRALDLPNEIVEAFSAEFLGGMAGDANRSRRLGDTGESAPQRWKWGGPGGGVIHVLLIVLSAADVKIPLEALHDDLFDRAFTAVGEPLFTSNMDGVEPFGFADGISQPLFDWDRKLSARDNTTTYSNDVALGELLLGYPNEYGKYTDRPLIETVQDPDDRLLPAEDRSGSKDFGLNGTYLVMRQLDQDVRRFWRFLDDASVSDPVERYCLAAAMVGRTLNGTPLISDAGETIGGVERAPGNPLNSFTYEQDAAGVECPFGAHIRRANPRNADLFGRPEDTVATIVNLLGLPRPKLRDDLIASTRFHRLLRRGREYGEELTPEEALQPGPRNEAPRGLYFITLGANIARQFEFIQNAWLMSTKFNGLNEESDPLLGNREPVGNCPVTGDFTIPREGKVARRVTGLPQFVTVRGGAYFFMPSCRALRYIGQLRTSQGKQEQSS